MRSYTWLLTALLGAAIFLITGHLNSSINHASAQPEVKDRVVISAPVQLLMYAGDSFLAADLELFRLASTAAVSGDSDSTGYLIRAHLLVSQLNPCHEDNYYIGNTLLSWGGAESEGSDLLRRATECRSWDYIPPFLYGMNQHYFHRNNQEAQRALELAASRSPENYATLRKTAIMIAVGEFQDDRMARDYLQRQYEQAADAKLRDMLEKRVGRLDGLIILRTAQKKFEQQFGRPLASPQELLAKGIIQRFPPDPLGIGYEYRNGTFLLRQLRIAGTEKRR
jgi:hypothetical protein